MTATLFMILVLAVAAGVLLAAWRFLPRRAAVRLSLGLPLWLAFVGTLSLMGVVRDPTLPVPGAVFVIAPAVLFVVFLVRSQAGPRAALAVPLWLLLGAHAYRIGAELALHRLWVEGLVPRMLTYEGANLDILVGATAPVAAWLATRGRGGLRLALGWNALGLLSLANVAGRSVMTAPGPLNWLTSEVPNLAVGTFPFTFLAGLLAPLAVALHVLAIRAIRHRLRESNPDSGKAAALGHGWRSHCLCKTYCKFSSTMQKFMHSQGCSCRHRCQPASPMPFAARPTA